MSEIDLIKDKVTSMASLLYGLEAMTYFTSGLTDVQADEDIAVEAAMTRLFALNTSKQVAQLSKSILGKTWKGLMWLMFERINFWIANILTE